MIILGVCIIIFAGKLGQINYEHRGLLDGFFTHFYRLKKETVGKFTGTSWKLSTFIFLWRLFGVLWIAFMVFIISQVLSSA
jgi:hypothetical protein